MSGDGRGTVVMKVWRVRFGDNRYPILVLKEEPDPKRVVTKVNLPLSGFDNVRLAGHYGSDITDGVKWLFKLVCIITGVTVSNYPPLTTVMMDVKVLEPTTTTTTVYPSHQPFTVDHILPLSHLDTDRNMNVPFRYVRAYAAADHQNADPFDVITTALSTALVKFYAYTGSLHRRKSDGRFELHCKVGTGVPVISATVDSPLSSVNYLDDADEEFIELLVPNPDQEARLTHVLILQVTRFSCGGYTLGAAVHHALSDGMGATLFFNAMAEVARGASEVKVEPVWDRAELLGPREPARTEFPIEEFLCLDKDFVPYSGLNEDVVREICNVKDDWLDRFKSILQEKSGSSFTTFEALGAVLWQASGGVAVSKNWSRVKDSSEKSLLFLDLWRSSAVSKKENPLIYGDRRLMPISEGRLMAISEESIRKNRRSYCCWFQRAEHRDEGVEARKRRNGEADERSSVEQMRGVMSVESDEEVKASKVPRDEKVKFGYAVNIRRVIQPPLPSGYFGNGCVPMYAQTTAGDLIDKPIWETADLIKKSKRNVSDEYVHSFIDFQELNYEKGINAGKWVSAVTDWRHLGHSTVDFGWGGPVTVIPLSRNLLGSSEPCFFLPYSAASQGKKDGFKVLLYLRKDAVVGFREEMEKFVKMEL
ncbi:hypothetical protein LXL04_010305 [Taraxacum kok-saghyz]